ncbi:DNA recombination protein RmuC [Rhodobacteraceae bacterium NNCM2]|nr:DNA recombination protein RmuC [Coraliihabitans acroporae]
MQTLTWPPDWSDPLVLALAIGAAGLVLMLLLVLLAVNSGRRAARSIEPLAASMEALGNGLAQLGQNQQQLQGGLRQVTESQIAAQARLMETVNHRLEQVSARLGESLTTSSTRTARSLGDLQQRLEAIDKAQTNIEKLSGDVLSLQDILSNKQTRGAFGEIQLTEIVSRALPPDAYSLQASLSNGKRADCLIHLPAPPGPIVIDSKFPLEAYEALRAAKTEEQLKRAARALRGALATHIQHIAERYIIEGETADSALLFLPSEAVYAELHANFADVVRQGFEARVWIVSPTTAMAVLNTMRGVLKDARMRKEATRIRRELGLLTKDTARLVDRVANLDRHFQQAAGDIEQIKISAEKAGNRAGRLEAFDFDEDEPVGVAAQPTALTR